LAAPVVSGSCSPDDPSPRPPPRPSRSAGGRLHHPSGRRTGGYGSARAAKRNTRTTTHGADRRSRCGALMRPAARRTAIAVRVVVFDVGGVLEHAIDTYLDGRWEQRLRLAAGEFFARLRRAGLGQDANLGGVSEATHLPLARRPPRRGGLLGRHRGERGGGPHGRDTRGACSSTRPRQSPRSMRAFRLRLAGLTADAPPVERKGCPTTTTPLRSWPDPRIHPQSYPLASLTPAT
jgi:hypothetical protein